MAIHTQAQRFNALNGRPTIEWGLARTNVAENLDARFDDKRWQTDAQTSAYFRP